MNMHAPLTSSCPYCTSQSLRWRPSRYLASCPICRRTSIRFRPRPSSHIFKIVPLDTIILVGAGAAIILAFSALALGQISLRTMIRSIASYMMVVGSLGVVEAAATMRTGILRTRLSKRLVQKAPKVSWFFSLLWGLTGLLLGLIGLVGM